MIERSMVQEIGPHKFVAEASDIGLRPGEWPLTLEVSGVGNGLPFLRTAKKVDGEGDLIYVRYDQQYGCVTLQVLND